MRSPVLGAALLLATTAVAAPKVPRIDVGLAERQPIIHEVPLTGTLTSPRVARVSASVSGLVETMQVDVGDRVAAGDALMTLDQELESWTLKAARAAADEARAELADARRRLAEARELTAQQTIAATELRALEAQVEIDRAALARLEAEQQRQAARLRRHAVDAPFDGVVSRRLTEVGEWVDPGTPLLELTAVSGLRLDFRVPQQYFTRIDDAAELQVEFGALPGSTYDARIGAVVPVNDPSARTFLLRAYPEAGQVALTPGMSARGTLRLHTDRQGVVVPRDALLRYPDGRTTVWVVAGDGEEAQVSERQVRTGLGFDGQVEIVSGLEPGERVVTRGNESLQEGQSVQVVAAD